MKGIKLRETDRGRNKMEGKEAIEEEQRRVELRKGRKVLKERGKEENETQREKERGRKRVRE